MSRYQALRDDINAQVDNTRVLDNVITELIRLETRKIDRYIGRNLPIEHSMKYINLMKQYTEQKLFAHRVKKNCGRNYRESLDIAFEIRQEARKELLKY